MSPASSTKNLSPPYVLAPTGADVFEDGEFSTHYTGMDVNGAGTGFGGDDMSFDDVNITSKIDRGNADFDGMGCLGEIDFSDRNVDSVAWTSTVSV